jgi:hypothetical protein
LKLHALSQHIRADENGSFPEFAHWILVAEREKKHDKILSKISRYNRRLIRLLEDPNASTSETAEIEEEQQDSVYGARRAYSAEGSKSGISGINALTSDPPYEVRQIIDKLYNVLVSSWAKTCKLPHKAILRLATHRRQQQDSGSKKDEDADIARDFDLVFPTHGWPCLWKQTRISTIIRCVGLSRFMHGFAYFVKVNLLMAPLYFLSEGSNSQVKWAKRQTRTKKSFLKRAAPQPIESICAVLNRSGTCFHVRVQDDAMWKLPPSSGPDYLPLSDENPTVSLKTIIEYAACLTVRQKRIFAVNLAYSLLYLSQTVWLEREWTKDDICFLQSTNQHIDICRPYFSVDFANSGSVTELYDEGIDCDHIAPSILGFGILLIELEFGKPIESLWKSGDLRDGQKNPNTNKTAAMRFLETGREWDDYYYQRFRSAVSACISGKFLDPDIIEDDLSFQKAIYENVVMKLEEELFFGYTLRADSLDDFPYNPSFAYQDFHTHNSISVVVETKVGSLFDPFGPETYHIDGQDGFHHDIANRVFDSATMAVPASKMQPRKYIFHSPYLTRQF